MSSSRHDLTVASPWSGFEYARSAFCPKAHIIDLPRMNLAARFVSMTGPKGSFAR